MTDPLKTRPKTVAIVALGPSNHDFVNGSACKKDFLDPDEVWVINSALGTFNADKAFIMDDLRGIERRFPQWAGKLKHTKVPIITCREIEEYPTSINYPKDEVCKCVKDDLFTNSVAYAIGYAIYIKVQDLYLFGCDFWYPGSQAVESGASNCAYLLGIAKERGIHFRIPKSSTLLDAHLAYQDKEDGQMRRPLYGYDYNPGEMMEKSKRGSATEIEKVLANKAPTPLLKPAVPQQERKIPPNGEDQTNVV